MDLFFRKTGDGPPMMILHGLYGSSDNWLSVAAILSRYYTIYIPDLRNHGQSPHHEIHDYNAMCYDVEKFAERYIGSRFVLLGHSMGGKLAVTCAVRNPSVITALIVADISPFHKPDEKDPMVLFHKKILTALADPELTARESRTEIEARLKEVTGNSSVAAFLSKNLRRNSDGTFSLKLNATALLNNMESIMGQVPVPRDAIVTGFPVLFIRGSESGYLPEDHFPEIQRVFPAAEMITIRGAGHWLHAEKPEGFTGIIRDFLG